MSNFNPLRVKLYALVAAIVLGAFVAASPAWAQHQEHDMSNMPGMGKPKPTPKPQQKKKQQPVKPRQDDMGNMPGMDMKGMPMPSPSPTPTPASSPSPSPPPSPSPSPQKMDMNNMPGMQMPVTSTSPSPAPSASPEKMDPNMQMSPANQAPVTDTLKSNQDESGGMGNMQMNGSKDGSTHDMAGMSRMPGMNSMNMGPLMVMTENDMGIRVGSSQTNIMSMGQMGSGTAWQPSTGPMHMYHKVAGDWLLMFHYNLIAGLNRQGGPRGVTKFESENWFMPMAYHKLGRGTVQLRAMFSAEPFTFAPGGSPLLFQTGETYKGQPLIDKQHPHDLFMELSAQYTLPVGERGTWFTYFGYPGEPALGPVAFMHRASASENPSATLAHHLQDSTHISFGVLTTGFTYRWFKLEGSVFNGREPDENRYNFDAHKWNSRSARLSFAPNRNWATQVSYGFLRSPEGQEPDTDVRRATASVQYNKPFKRGNWASALIWGRNHLSSPEGTHNLNGYTLESTVNFLDKNYLYTRLELVDKDELLRASDRALLGMTDHHPSFRIGAYTFGGARDIVDTDKLSLAVGSDLTFYSKPDILNTLYGQNPVSWKLFFRIRPGKMNMGGGGSTTHGTHGNMGNMGGETQPNQ
jgi:hypothetical protein